MEKEPVYCDDKKERKKTNDRHTADSALYFFGFIGAATVQSLRMRCWISLLPSARTCTPLPLARLGMATAGAGMMRHAAGVG